MRAERTRAVAKKAQYSAVLNAIVSVLDLSFRPTVARRETELIWNGHLQLGQGDGTLLMGPQAGVIHAGNAASHTRSRPRTGHTPVRDELGMNRPESGSPASIGVC